MKLIGFYDYTVILTYMSLVSAVIGMICASRGSFGAGVICVMISGICDAFDGTVARTKKNRTPDEKSFGIQIKPSDGEKSGSPFLRKEIKNCFISLVFNGGYYAGRLVEHVISHNHLCKKAEENFRFF